MIFLKCIEGLEIVDKQIKKGRWQVTLSDRNGRRGKMAHYEYIWLKGNPSFRAIPPGYLIHHLDLDPLNDDVSNLALMFRHHHWAYHLKHKNVVGIRLEFLKKDLALGRVG